MIPYAAYKFIHIIGVIFLFLSLGAYLMLSSNKVETGRRLAGITHGIAAFIILLGGFGLLARLGISSASGWPLWVWVKLAVWVILAVVIVLIKRRPELRTLLWFIIPILGAVAAYMAIYKVQF